MARRLRFLFVGLAVGVLLATAAAVRWVSKAFDEPYRAWAGTETIVDLPRDSDAGSILKRLGWAGVIRHPRLARAWAASKGWDRDLRAGEYRFDRSASIPEVLDRLRRGDVVLHPVTIPEGLTLDEVARRMAAAGFGTVDALLTAFRDPAPIHDFDPEAPDLEGYLFPDTYFFPRQEQPVVIARTMAKRFLEVAGSSDFTSRALGLGLTARRAVVLASLIEKETALAEERPRISRVFHNRLDRDMLLQCDPTVQYALRREGREVAVLLRGDLAFPSPWNTYVTKGLPPGPICSPGRESLASAVAPSAGGDLYFVASPGGGHRFSRDLTSHERAVREWRRYERSSR